MPNPVLLRKVMTCVPKNPKFLTSVKGAWPVCQMTSNCNSPGSVHVAKICGLIQLKPNLKRVKGLPPWPVFGSDFPFVTQISSFLFYDNVFQTQYSPLRFSGSLEQFLKRSIPVCLVQKHLGNLNISENFTVSKIDDQKFYLVHPQIFFSQKDPGFVRFRSILNDPQNLSKKYWVWKKLEQFSNQKKKCFFF